MSAHLQTPRYEADRLADLLTIGDVACLLGISRGSVYSLIRSGELVPIRVGQRARFEPADVRAYLDRGLIGNSLASTDGNQRETETPAKGAEVAFLHEKMPAASG